jgi:hypothetical protein
LKNNQEHFKYFVRYINVGGKIQEFQRSDKAHSASVLLLLNDPKTITLIEEVLLGINSCRVPKNSFAQFLENGTVIFHSFAKYLSVL